MPQKPTVGRIVHVYSSRWDGPRPGIIVAVKPASDPDGEILTNVNVFLDGTQDAGVLAVFRLRATGNTIANMGIHEPLTTPARIGILANTPAMPGQGVFWAEWPPMAPLPAMATRAATNGHAPELRPSPAVVASDATGGEPTGPVTATSEPVKPADDDGN